MTIRFPTFARARDVARASDASDDETRRSRKLFTRENATRGARERPNARRGGDGNADSANECVSRPPMTRRRRRGDARRGDPSTRSESRDADILFRPRRALEREWSIRSRSRDASPRRRVRPNSSRRVATISKIIHERDSSRASSHTSTRGRPARGRRRARGRSAAHRRLRRLRRVSRVSRARENDDERRPP